MADDNYVPQYAIIKEDEHNGSKFIIVQDELNDDFGFAIEGSHEFETNDYPNFDWFNDSAEEAEAEARTAIDSMNESAKSHKTTGKIASIVHEIFGEDYECEIGANEIEIECDEVADDTVDRLCDAIQSEFPEFIGGDFRCSSIINDGKTKIRIDFIDVAEKSKPINESVTSASIIKQIGVGIAIPKYVVEKFGEKAFLDKEAVKTSEGRIVFYNRVDSHKDAINFFSDYYSVMSELQKEIETMIENLDRGLPVGEHLDVGIKTVMGDLEEVFLSLK